MPGFRRRAETWEEFRRLRMRALLTGYPLPLRPNPPTYTVTEPVVMPIPATNYWKDKLPVLQQQEPTEDEIRSQGTREVRRGNRGTDNRDPDPS